jgi:outer membrane protein
VNQASFVLNIVLAVAVAVLYYLHFSGPGQAGEKPGAAANVPAGQNIVFINSDSILSNYSYLDDAQAELAQKREKVEKQLMARQGSLRQAAESFQRRYQGGTMTPNEAQREQQALGQQEQELLAYRDNVTAGLMEEEKIITNRFYDTLVSYLRDYNKDKKYQFILGYSKGGGILLANDKLDVTNDILKGLNERYKVVKGKQDASKKEEEKK